jgi:hypothetical protein
MELHGTYTGPSYGTMDYRDGLESFTSLRQAQERFSERLHTSGAWPLDVTRVTFSDDGSAWTEEAEFVCFPATTYEDVLTLYVPGNYDNIAWQITAGPHGGVRTERG